MVTYQQLERDPASSGLFKNRIKTLDSFRNLQNKDTAFIALDTEHFPVESEQDRVLHQVGLAFINSIPANTSTGITRLQDFYTHGQVEVLTLNIDITNKRRDITRIRGGIPARRPLRFGQERLVQQADLEAAVIQFVHACSAMTKTRSPRLVLVGFGMAAEWEYLFRYFPKLICHLSAWADLRDIGQDIAQVGVLPSLTTTLQIFGHSRIDLKPGRQGTKSGTADNAGDDAVAALALAQSFFQPENQEKLRFRQACGQIARMFTKKKKDTSHQFPRLTQFPFTATIEFQGHPLPQSINSGVRLARTFFDFAPKSIGTISTKIAYLTFQSQNELDRFIQNADGLVLPTGEALSACVYSSRSEAQVEEASKQKEKQALREQRRLARAEEDEMEELGGLFS